MSQTVSYSSPIPEIASGTSRLALSMMDKHHISATPENYSVWFRYVESENKELLREIDTIIVKKLNFTEETNQYLYHKYIIPASPKDMMVENTADNAHKLLTEVLKRYPGLHTRIQQCAK